jgi:hypothetical protein
MPTVKFAVYGALRDSNQDNTEAAIVTAALQTAIDNSPHGNGVVTIDNNSMDSPGEWSSEAFRCDR